ncbi:MAG TPA: ferritin-like domain-containing protein [Conexibacter sp.]|jgi:hypothetical protein|nr:ferritin-like domain-containing protein [Conexibacter sp.]
MSLPAWLRAYDRDDAIAEAFGGALSRRQTLQAGAAGAAALTVHALAADARAADSSGAATGDVAVLNYALTLEYIQAAFYSEAERAGVLHGPLAEQARVVGAHERAHVAAFRRVLGTRAIAAPRFDFRGTTEDPAAFRKTAVAFEDLAVAAYKDQIPLLRQPAFLAAAVAIHSVEARHAAWIRRLAGVLPAARAFDEPLPRAQVARLVASTRFVVSLPRTTGTGAPHLTG